MRDATTFGPKTTTDEVLEGLDLGGRTALVTGGSSGLGKETARSLAAHGAKVVLTARDVPKGEQAAAEIRASTGNAAVEVAELELGSLAAIRTAAGRIVAAQPRFDLLINNAGVMACPFAKTTDGFELQFGSNHLGHFLFTLLMLPALRRGDAPRIVNLSSRGHHIAPVDFDDLHFERRAYDKWQSYGQAKTANVLFTVGLERRLAGDGIHAFAVHPGAIMTELGRHLQLEDIQYLQTRTRGMQFKSVEQGAATSCFAATAPELANRGGLYLEDCHVAAIDDAPEAPEGVKSYALDPAAAERLWDVSERAVGARFA